MTGLQIFLLGIMVSWTPTAVVLACLIYRTPLAAKDSAEPHTDEAAATLVPSDSAVSAELPPAQSAPSSATSGRRVCKTI